MRKNSISLVAYADGACKNNNSLVKKRLGGCGFIIAEENDNYLMDQYVRKEKKDIASLRNEILKNKQFTCRAVPLCEQIEPPNKFSNNRAELEALNGVLAHILQRAETESKQIHLTIKLDSEYVIKVFNNANQWQKNDWKLSSGTTAANIDYAKQTIVYTEALRRRNHVVSVQHVMAHQSEPNLEESKEKWLDWFYNDFADRLSNIAAQTQTDINYATTSKKRKRNLSTDHAT